MNIFDSFEQVYITDNLYFGHLVHCCGGGGGGGDAAASAAAEAGQYGGMDANAAAEASIGQYGGMSAESPAESGMGAALGDAFSGLSDVSFSDTASTPAAATPSLSDALTNASTYGTLGMAFGPAMAMAAAIAGFVGTFSDGTGNVGAASEAGTGPGGLGGPGGGVNQNFGLYPQIPTTAKEAIATPASTAGPTVEPISFFDLEEDAEIAGKVTKADARKRVGRMSMFLSRPDKNSNYVYIPSLTSLE